MNLIIRDPAPKQANVYRKLLSHPSQTSAAFNVSLNGREFVWLCVLDHVNTPKNRIGVQVFGGSPNLWERCLPANPDASVCQAHPVIVHLGQARLLQMLTEPVGAVLARESGAAIGQQYRAIVHRGQARLLQMLTEPVGAVLARDRGASVRQAYDVIVHRGQVRSYRINPTFPPAFPQLESFLQ